MSYTFYGDLLGMSGYYQLSPKRADSRLNDFYNISFDCLSDYCNQNKKTVQVNMFSDSIFIWGDNEGEILPILQILYLQLMGKGLLLKGSVVSGKLQLEPRITLSNFRKALPKHNILARAVGLQQTQKGARLLIENSLAEDILENCQEWLTQDGYLLNPKPDVPLDSPLRRISQTPDNKTYEFLYLWARDNTLQNSQTLEKIEKQLNELSTFFMDDISIHYSETLKLFERCKKRSEFTTVQFGLNQGF